MNTRVGGDKTRLPCVSLLQETDEQLLWDFLYPKCVMHLLLATDVMGSNEALRRRAPHEWHDK